jgi:hypothetical protein
MPPSVVDACITIFSSHHSYYFTVFILRNLDTILPHSTTKIIKHLSFIK